MNYRDMTDEEYDALDEEMTRNPPKWGPNGSGALTQWELRNWGYSRTAPEGYPRSAEELAAMQAGEKLVAFG